VQFLLGRTLGADDKSRMRRHLEVYHPETISKLSEDTTDLFRQVMAYDVPRPRATEKDTKVLQWRDIRSAVEKSLMGYVTYVRRGSHHFLRLAKRCDHGAHYFSPVFPHVRRGAGPQGLNAAKLRQSSSVNRPRERSASVSTPTSPTLSLFTRANGANGMAPSIESDE